MFILWFIFGGAFGLVAAGIILAILSVIGEILACIFDLFFGD